MNVAWLGSGQRPGYLPSNSLTQRSQGAENWSECAHPGRSNIRNPECAGLSTNPPPAERCCSRGRLHSVSVAFAPLR